MPHRHLAPLLAALLALAVQAAPGNGDTGTQPEDRSHLPQLGDPYLPPAARKPAQRTPLAGAALQAQARAKLQQRFAAADTLKTGSISLAQAKAAGLGYVVQHFAEIDRQGSGRVSFEQVERHQQNPR